MSIRDVAGAVGSATCCYYLPAPANTFPFLAHCPSCHHAAIKRQECQYPAVYDCEPFGRNEISLLGPHGKSLACFELVTANRGHLLHKRDKRSLFWSGVSRGNSERTVERNRRLSLEWGRAGSDGRTCSPPPRRRYRLTSLSHGGNSGMHHEDPVQPDILSCHSLELARR